MSFIGSAQQYMRPMGPCEEHGHWLAQTGRMTVACDLCDFEGYVVGTGAKVLVTDGEVVPVHRVRKEADFLLNRCEPGDICGAEDGCNGDPDDAA